MRRVEDGAQLEHFSKSFSPACPLPSCDRGTALVRISLMPNICPPHVRVDFWAVKRTNQIVPKFKPVTEPKTNWYAIKIYTAKPEVMKYLKAHGIETYIPMLCGKPLLGSLVFLHCTEEEIVKTKADWFHQVMAYRDADMEKPQAIPNSEMENFRMVLNIKNMEFIPLQIVDKHFLAGQKVRVLDGPLNGAIGVIKRIKGDRRLVVSVSGITAVATCFIRPELLENVEE